MKNNVVIGFLGTKIDAGKKSDRWNRWRPSIALHQQQEFLIDRFELIHDRRHLSLAQFIAQDIALVSPETKVNLVEMDIRDPWDFEEVYQSLHDFCLQYDFKTDEEEYFVHLTTGTHVAQICTFLLTEARYLPARLIQASPPRTKAEGPGPLSMIDLDLSKYDKLVQRFEEEHASGAFFLKGAVETRNPAFNAMIEQIEKVAIQSHAPVLLHGPTGAGKSNLAERIYQLKKIRHKISGDFVAINCATIKGDRAMSALFGHKKGAFGEAVTERKGMLRLADKGVLFLDEIDELGLDEQALILDAIEHGRFYPYGSDREVQSHFQLIAGATKDLAKEVREGRFRADLYARLNLWTFALPPLIERREDIEPNLDYEFKKQVAAGKENIAFAADARKAYIKFAMDPSSAWHGNFRDLSASVTRMITLAPRGRITKAIVKEEIQRLQAQWHEADRDDAFTVIAELLGPDDASKIDRFDIVQLAEVIRICKTSNSMSAAGRKLFSISRASKKSANDSDRLKKYLAKFGLDWKSVQPS